jgi:hypothetical protein
MENNGRWTILDGLHRIAKAYIQGREYLKEKKVPRSRINEILKIN